jgi:RNA polymerase sigma-70 factor (ECF subfamily)
MTLVKEDRSVTDEDLLAERFEADRPRLRAVAHRMLGSEAEADDAVQEAWLRLRRVDADALDNLGAWLTTVVGRVCLDMLRSRAVRKEDPLDGGHRPDGPVPDTALLAGSAGAIGGGPAVAGPAVGPSVPIDPAAAAELADTVGVALFVVLETLNPLERLAFVLHDLFAVPFEEIAPIVGRSPAAARQLASRARRRVQSDETDSARPPTAPPTAHAARQRRVVEAFLAASRGGDFGALLTLLDPDVVLRVDGAGHRAGAPAQTHGRGAVARFFSGRARTAVPAFIDGAAGAVVMAGGKPRVAITFIIVDGMIIGLEAVGETDVIGQLDLRLA